MGGSAILDPEVLIDDLIVDVVDGLREELHPQFGIRAFRVYLVKRTWAGRSVGEGKFTDVAVEIRPQPKVWTWDGLRWGLEACGLNEMGEVKLTEVSLTFTSAELTGGMLNANQMFYVKIGEAHGQGNPDRFFVHVRPPFPDRTKDLGWVLALKRTNLSDQVDLD